MTIVNENTFVSAAGDGVTVTFNLTNMHFFLSTDLAVYLRDDTTGIPALQTEGAANDYTVTGTDTSSGAVVFNTAPASGKTVIVLRKPGFLQNTDWPADGKFPAESHEDAADLLTELALYLKYVGARSIRFEDAASAGSNEIPGGTVSKYLFIDANGDLAIQNGFNFFVQAAAPTDAESAEGDLWVDSDSTDNDIYKYLSGVWTDTGLNFTLSPSFASGTVFNWDDGDILLTHSANVLALTGGLLFLQRDAGAAFRVQQSQDAAAVQNARWEGFRGTPADGDEAYHSYYLSHDGAVSSAAVIEMARMTWTGSDVSEDSEDAFLTWSVIVNGVLTETMHLAGPCLSLFADPTSDVAGLDINRNEAGAAISGPVGGTAVRVVSEDGEASHVVMINFGTGDNSVISAKARGTGASPTAIQNNDVFGGYTFRGHDGVDFTSGSRAAMLARATENWSASGHGIRLIFRTTENGDTTTVDRWAVDHDGTLLPITDSAYNIGGAANRVAEGHFDQVLIEDRNLGAWSVNDYSDRYYSPCRLADANTMVVAADLMYATPIVITARTTFTRIGVEITAAAGTNARLGIYSFDGGDHSASALLLDAGVVSTASIAEVEATISQVLEPGVYLLAVVFDNTPTVIAPRQNIEQGNILLGHTSPGNGALIHDSTLSVAHTFGALPSTFGTPTYIANAASVAPAVWLRKA